MNKRARNKEKKMAGEDNEVNLMNQTIEELVDEFNRWDYWSKYYEYITSYFLEWPLMTADWLPHKVKKNGDDFFVQGLVLGTSTEEEPNGLLMAKVQLPDEDAKIGETSYHYVNGQLIGYGNYFRKFVLGMRMNHEGAITRARIMPQRTRIIATKTPSSELFVYDAVNHPILDPTGVCQPDLRLHGHEKTGRSLSWNSNRKGDLLSGGEDNKICLWNINALPRENRIIDAKNIYTGHDAIVRDVQWYPLHRALFGSVGDDKKLMMWDTRCQDTSKAALTIDAHVAQVNCLSINSFAEFIVATGSSDKTIAVWDLRNFRHRLHSFDSQKDDIHQVQWSPHRGTSLASSGTDNRIVVWDVAQAGREQTPEEDEFGPPEMVFVHMRHGGPITDFNWNPSVPFLFCSTSKDKMVQVWKMAPVTDGDDDES